MTADQPMEAASEHDPNILRASFESIQASHEHVSKSIQRVILAILGASSYCAFALARSDLEILKSAGGLQLPLVGVQISMFAFLVVLPVIYSGLSLYFFSLLRLWFRLDRPFSPAPGEERRLQELEKEPYFFNQVGWMARLITFVLFFVMVPVVLLAVSWKAWPHMVGRFFIFPVAVSLSLTFWTLSLYWKNHIPRLVQMVVMLGIIAGFSQAIQSRRIELPPNADLSGADLRNYDFSHSEIKGAILDGADLREVNFAGANLAGASLKKARFEENNFTGANLRAAHFHKMLFPVQINFQDADLTAALLENVDFEANLKNAKLDCSRIKFSDFRKSDFQGVSLKDSILLGVTLEEPVHLEADWLQKQSQTCYQSWNWIVHIKNKRKNRAAYAPARPGKLPPVDNFVETSRESTDFNWGNWSQAFAKSKIEQCERKCGRLQESP